MKPSESDYRRAQDLGATARRGRAPVTSNPYQFDHTERGQLLTEAWHNAWEAENERRKS